MFAVVAFVGRVDQRKHGCRLLWNEKAKAKQFVERPVQWLGVTEWDTVTEQCDSEARDGLLLLRCPLLPITSTRPSEIAQLQQRSIVSNNTC